jgi:hypothetical protein
MHFTFITHIYYLIPHHTITTILLCFSMVRLYNNLILFSSFIMLYNYQVNLIHTLITNLYLLINHFQFILYIDLN